MVNEQQQHLMWAIHVYDQNAEFLRGTVGPQVEAYRLALVQAGVPAQDALFLAQEGLTRYLELFLPEKDGGGGR